MLYNAILCTLLHVSYSKQRSSKNMQEDFNLFRSRSTILQYFFPSFSKQDKIHCGAIDPLHSPLRNWPRLNGLIV